jgi:hypothetical protein
MQAVHRPVAAKLHPAFKESGGQKRLDVLCWGESENVCVCVRRLSDGRHASNVPQAYDRTCGCNNPAHKSDTSKHEWPCPFTSTIPQASHSRNTGHCHPNDE